MKLSDVLVISALSAGTLGGATGCKPDSHLDGATTAVTTTTDGTGNILDAGEQTDAGTEAPSSLTLEEQIARLTSTRVHDCWGDINGDLNTLGLGRNADNSPRGQADRDQFYKVKDACPQNERPLIEVNELMGLIPKVTFKKAPSRPPTEKSAKAVKYVGNLDNDRYMAFTLIEPCVAALDGKRKEDCFDDGLKLVLKLEYFRTKEGVTLADVKGAKDVRWLQVIDFGMYSDELSRKSGSPPAKGFRTFEWEHTQNAYEAFHDPKDLKIYDFLNASVLPTLRPQLGSSKAAESLRFSK